MEVSEHICHLQLGTAPHPLLISDRQTSDSEDLFKLALGWIREDRDLRLVQEKEKGRQGGLKAVGDVRVPVGPCMQRGGGHCWGYR